MALSASFGLSWTRPVGPGGRSEGPASLAHGIAFPRFFVNDAFFPRLRFSSLQGGVKGGPGAILEHFWDPPEAQNGPLDGPLSAPSTPHTYFYVIFVYLFSVQVDCREFSMDFFFEITIPWPGGVRGAIESAAPLGHGVPNCSRYLRIQEPDGIRTLRRDLHGLGPKPSES